MDDVLRVGVLEGLADLDRDPHDPGHRQAVAFRSSQQLIERAAGHVLAHDVGLHTLIPHVVDGDDVGVIAEAGHRLGLATDAGQTRLVQPLGPYDRNRHVAFEPGVVREVDAFAAALAEQGLHPVTPTREAGG